MREILKSDTVFKVRSLTRGEIKQLRSEGFELLNLTRENADAALERAFEMIFTEDEIRILDALENSPHIMEIWIALLAETYGHKDEEKNLSRSGAGTQTAGE